MTQAPLPPDEPQRLQALQALQVLDTPPEPALDALVQAAALVCQVPVSLLSLVDAERQWFKAEQGLAGVRQTPRDQAFCAHAILQDGVFEVPDALADPRFANNPLVTARPDIRFYAGAPLRLDSGAQVGTLCVIDHVPRQLSPTQRQVLQHLAVTAAQLLQSHRSAVALAASQAAHHHERQRLAAIIDATGTGAWEWHMQTGELRLTERTAQLLGTNLADWAPTHIDAWLARMPDEDQAGARQALDAHLAGHTPGFLKELRLRHQDGHWVWVMLRGRLISRSADGRPEWMYGVIVDIAARKQQEARLRRSEDLLRRTGALAQVGGWELDIASGELSWSEQTCAIHGLPAGHQPTLAEAIGYYALEARPVIEAAVAQAIAGGNGWDLELPFIPQHGRRIWVRAVGQAEFEQGRAVRLVGAFQDIDQQVRQRQALAEQHELLRVTLQSIGDAVITTDAQGVVTWMNPVAERLTGWPSADSMGRPLGQVFHIVNEQDRRPAPDPVAACLHSGQTTGLAQHTLLVSRGGHEFGIEDSAAPIRGGDGQVLGAVLVFHDVTEQRRLSGEMRHRAAHDALTGLVNRGEFEARLARVLASAQRDHSRHALLYIDLDQFKLVNDACGHAVGDLLLQKVARLLAETVRGRDTLARLGGDEFAVVLEHCGQAQAERVAQQLCERLEQFRFAHEERRFRIGASIGLVPLDLRWPSAAAAMQAADVACYAAKEAGRHRVHVWHDSDQAMQARQGQMQWAHRLTQALDEDRFVLHAQRIQSLDPADTGLHAELLLRLAEADGSLSLPGAFLPAAERFHLATRIDRWVLARALRLLQAVPEIDRLHTLCVNLSGQSIGDRDFHRFAIDALAGAGQGACERLCLEVTETAAVTNIADAQLFAQQVRRLGVRIALDDFGAGASSFGYLKRLPVDLLKIDGQFITGLVDDPLDAAAVRGFVDVARVVGVKTVAEWVDRPELLQRVREMGIHYAQGFLLHRPEPAEQVLGLVGVPPG